MTGLLGAIKLLEPYDLAVVVLGLGVLGLATLLLQFKDYPFSFPIVALALGYSAWALPLQLPPLDPLEHRALVVHLTEIGVILSLMGVGLKLDRRPHWATWSPTWRLLLICMPLTIAGVALLGWWMLGLAPASALLLGAALAPTDPVLAADVQVAEPEGEAAGDSRTTGEQQRENQDSSEGPEEREDELRFALTSEAGLNDSLAFPFTYLAMLLLSEGLAPANWLQQWLVVDVAYRIVVGIVAGVALGWALSLVLLRLPVETEQQRMKSGVGALAGTLLLYGLTECVGGYGFLAVFIGGLTIRHREHVQQSHRSMHTFAEQSEQLMMTAVLILLGGAIAGGMLVPITWEAAALGLLLLLIVRPAAGLLSLLGETRLSWLDRGVVSFFGIRGIGCLYYLAYALHQASFASEELLWAVCGFVVVLSVLVHGIAAAPVMQFRDRRLN